MHIIAIEYMIDMTSNKIVWRVNKIGTFTAFDVGL